MARLLGGDVGVDSVPGQGSTFTVGLPLVTRASDSEREATVAGRLLTNEGLAFDVAFTSVLKRAIRTLGITLDALDLLWIPVTKHWRLNERHYGALQGLDKKATTERHGAEQAVQLAGDGLHQFFQAVGDVIAEVRRRTMRVQRLRIVVLLVKAKMAWIF